MRSCFHVLVSRFSALAFSRSKSRNSLVQQKHTVYVIEIQLLWPPAMSSRQPTFTQVYAGPCRHLVEALYI